MLVTFGVLMVPFWGHFGRRMGSTLVLLGVILDLFWGALARFWRTVGGKTHPKEIQNAILQTKQKHGKT